MPAYLVRTIKKKDLVGIFVADHPEDLMIAVDECVNPDECEFKELPVGGIFWPEPAIEIPIETSDEDDLTSDVSEIPWSAVSISDSWWDSFYTEDVTWLGFEDLMGDEDDSDDDPDPSSQPEPPKPKRPILKLV